MNLCHHWCNHTVSKYSVYAPYLLAGLVLKTGRGKAATLLLAVSVAEGGIYAASQIHQVETILKECK